MKAKKFFSSALKFVLIGVVGAFLALHSINLFSFVFPPDQQYLAWLGFGLTGLGAVAYLLMFLWEGATVLQRSVSLGMAFVCSIGEVLAAIFGMQIESWRKAGFALTESDFQTMLMVIGFLSIAHFFALITYFAGDRIGELFGDEDGDGTPNYRDNDYKSKKNKGSNNQPKQPQQQNQPSQNQFRPYTLNELLSEIGMSKSEVIAAMESQGLVGESETRQALKSMGRWPADLSGNNFKKIFAELTGSVNGHKQPQNF